MFDEIDHVFLTPPLIGTWRVAMKVANPLIEAAVFVVSLHVSPSTMPGPRSVLKHREFEVIFSDDGMSFKTTGNFEVDKRDLSAWCKLTRGLSNMASGEGILAITPASGETMQFPVTGPLTGPDTSHLPQLLDFFEGWRKLIGLAGVDAREEFTLDDARNTRDAQVAVGLLLDQATSGYLELDIGDQIESDDAIGLYYNTCSFAGATVSFCARVYMQRVPDDPVIFRSKRFEPVEIRSCVENLDQWGEDHAEAEGTHIVLRPDLISMV